MKFTFDDNLVKNLIKNLGYSSLYPIQELAIDHGLLEGKNLLITSPTASGKTLTAMMAAIKTIEKNKKAVYITPLRSLTTEKYNDFLELAKIASQINNKKSNNGNDLAYIEFIVKAASSDFVSTEKDLKDANIIIMTNEKLDSLLRQDSSWISDVGLFVFDEVHLIGNKERGPTLEMMLTKVKKLYPNSQILALSATISNSKEIAEWIGCTLLESNWRPTKLIEGVYQEGTIRTNDNNNRLIRLKKISMSAPVDVALDSLENGGQSLIFGETRKRTSSLAAKAVEPVFKTLTPKEKSNNLALSKKLLKNGEDTESTKALASLISKGVAFHHAGLSPIARELVEKGFRQGHIKLLVATPTLAAGVNLPARRVVLSSVLRYDIDSGTNVPISILDYKQFCGRAGRPQYDSYGEAIIVSESGINSEELYDHYILGTPEPIKSRLGNEKALRFHLLSTISTIPGMKKEEIYDMFLDTLFAQSYRKVSVTFKIDTILDYLENEGLIKSRNQRYIVTEFGKQTSILYIDPLTAVEFKKALEFFDNIDKSKKDNSNYNFGFLNVICTCEDFYPKLSMRKKDYDLLYQLIELHSSELVSEIREYDFSRSLLALYEWINETNDRDLSDRLGVEPGDMHRIVETTDWLLYSFYQLAKVFQYDNVLQKLHDLRIRVKYGIKEDLLSLVSLEGIGRVRARALYKAGITDQSKISATSLENISRIPKIGLSVAKKIKEQVKKKKYM